jgi:pimeloyl-ACP methyl ester carboxylesterase
MDGPMVSLNFLSENAKFHIPVLFIQGDDDDVTPTSLVRTYLRQIRAPGKSLVVLHNAGHLAVMAYPDDFLKEMLRFLSRQVHKSDQS